ncbi:hypothetical protein [Streptomyces orinoci]|uniref:Uncharacterized protein n=1 Tax=Streptomyces orinoci TaxID=67339 RepID=A0ABV3K3B4_STRON|nr:hypothetical protein [Streptomyces orinoci]
MFPHDSTGDQWFDHRQSDAYRALGHWIGEWAGELLGGQLPDEQGDDRAGNDGTSKGS